MMRMRTITVTSSTETSTEADLLAAGIPFNQADRDGDGDTLDDVSRTIYTASNGLGQHPASGTADGYTVTTSRTPAVTLGYVDDGTLTITGAANGLSRTGAVNSPWSFSVSATPAAGRQWVGGGTESRPFSVSGTFNNQLTEAALITFDATEGAPFINSATIMGSVTPDENVEEFYTVNVDHGGAGALTYTWTVNGGSVTTGPDANGRVGITFTSSGAQSIDVEVDKAGVGTVDAPTFNVNVTAAAPAATFTLRITGPTSIPTGSSESYSGIPGGTATGNITWNWNIADADGTGASLTGATTGTTANIGDIDVNIPLSAPTGRTVVLQLTATRGGITRTPTFNISV